ncbi:hypothetical protein LINPERPRIM_LOCUS6679 [Linum perenne]
MGQDFTLPRNSRNQIS